MEKVHQTETSVFPKGVVSRRLFEIKVGPSVLIVFYPRVKRGLSSNIIDVMIHSYKILRKNLGLYLSFYSE